MARKKDDTLEAQKAEEAVVETTPTVATIVVGDVDYNEIMEIQKILQSTVLKLNELSGEAFRLTKAQEIHFRNELELKNQLEVKRKELIKRYKINDQKKWSVDINSKVVVYSD